MLLKVHASFSYALNKAKYNPKMESFYSWFKTENSFYSMLSP
jgi:hypothetical protein